MNDRIIGCSLVGEDAWQQSPSYQQWKELYDAALKFKQVECWNWMWDTDLFGVQNPENGKVGYCCVMGRGGEHFGLGVYLGTEGLETYRKILRDGDSLSLFDAVALQKCLMASFEDRRYLVDRDFNVIKSLSIKFRGHKAWPQFRSYMPGYAPWHLSRDEAKFLTVALIQAIDIALRFKGNPNILNRPSKNQYFVRVPKSSKQGLEWTDQWIEPAPFKKESIKTPFKDKDRLSKIEYANLRQSGIWETDLFYFPIPIAEKGQRPYYPHTILIVNHTSGLITGFHMIETKNFTSELGEKFLYTIKNLGTVPQEVLVKKQESFDILKPIAANLKIKLTKVKNLPMLEQAQMAFKGF